MFARVKHVICDPRLMFKIYTISVLDGDAINKSNIPGVYNIF